MARASAAILTREAVECATIDAAFVAVERYRLAVLLKIGVRSVEVRKGPFPRCASSTLPTGKVMASSSATKKMPAVHNLRHRSIAPVFLSGTPSSEPFTPLFIARASAAKTSLERIRFPALNVGHTIART